MTIEKLATVLPVENLAEAAEAWAAALGVEPTFVDSPRWAQFDVGGTRLALAGTDRTSEQSGVMAKVADLAGERNRLLEAGLAPGPIEQGPHEHRMTVTMPSGAVLVLYQPA